MRVFLILKHWQIFLLWFLSQILFRATIHTSYWLLSTIIYGFIMVGWFYSIGKVINKINKNKIENYHEDLWFILVMISLIPLAYFTHSTTPTNDLLFLVFTILDVFCLFKLINFSAKALKQNKEKKNLKFADYFGEFFLICIIGIGFWIIQPKLNMIIKTNDNETPNA